MTKGIILFLVLVLSSSLAWAGTTGRTTWSTPYDPLTEWLNNNDFDHNHSYEQTSKYKAPLGVELDITFWEMDMLGIPMGIGTRGNYDFNNGVWGCFGKISLNFSPMIKKGFGLK